MSEPLPRGITLFDLVNAIPPGSWEVFPVGVRGFLEHLSVVESDSWASANYDIVHGTARSVTDIVDADIDLGNGFVVEIPGVTEGLRFEYTSNRVGIGGAQNVEPAPALWQVAIFVDRLLVPFPGRAAQRAASTDGFVGPLVPDPDRTRSHVWVQGIVLVTNATVNPGGAPTAGATRVALIAPTDPFAPDSPSGTVLLAGLEPRHVLFGTSGFGLTMGEVLWDSTPAVTPDEIIARGHDAAWRGLSVADATLSLPRQLPFVGDVTLGIRDLLVGFAPDDGVQLEALLQMGEISRLDRDDGDADKQVLSFHQDVDGQISRLTTPDIVDVDDGVFHVEVTTAVAGDPVRVMARLDPPEAEARWRLPGTDSWITANDTGWLTVRPGDTRGSLGFRDIFLLEDGREADGIERTYGFVPAASATDDGGFPPKIAVTLDTQDLTASFTWHDVTSISGTHDQLALLRFTAIDPLPGVDDQDRLVWELRHGAETLTGLGTTIDPSVYWEEGTHVATLTDELGRRRRIEIGILADADRVVVGCDSVDGAGPIDDRRGPRQLVDDGSVATESPATPAGIIATYHLRSFHQDGERRRSDQPAILNPSAPPVLSIPDGALAEVTLGDAAVPHVLSAMRVRMGFDAKTPTTYRQIHPAEFDAEVGAVDRHVDPWGPADPYPAFPTDVTGGGPDRLRSFAEGHDASHAAAGELRTWAATVLDVDGAATFVVVGRTCDIGDDAYNHDLAIRRAEHGAALLTSPEYGPDGITVTQVITRGETEPASTLPPDPSTYATSTDPAVQDRTLAGRTASQFRIKVDYPDHDTWTEDRGLPQREEARCVDVYAVVTYPTGTVLSGGDADGQAVAPTRRRALVPGADLWGVITEPTRERQTSYALRVLAKWDSPSWQDAADSAPTLVEAALDWQQTPLTVPELGGGVEPSPAEPGGEAKVWQVLLRYTNDPRTRQMIISGALDTPGDDTGIARIVDASDGQDGIASDLALALGVAPALVTGIDGDDAGANGLATLGALGAVVAGSALLDIASKGEIILHRLEFGYGRAAGGGDTSEAQRIWLYADYTSGFDVSGFSLITGTGIVLGYERVGIELGDDVATTDLDGLAVAYDGPVEIVSPGVWEIEDPLARLLGVRDVRMGAGSLWIEVDLGLALQLGPITLEQATVRLTFSDPIAFELRGLVLGIDIPNVLHGEGRLAITERTSGDGAAVSAGLDLTVVPIGLGIDADFRYDEPMVHLEVGVTFATAIPLLNTGLGLFGLAGRFVSNGTRSLSTAPDIAADPVQRELDWLVRNVDEKYEIERGQTALGFGATVGTAIDSGFTFNLNGMLTIEFPDPSVVLTVAGRFVSLPEGAAEEGDAATSIDAALLGIVSVTPEGLAVGIRGEIEVPELLEIAIPIAAWFPFAGGDAGYVRIGSDGFGGRSGEPVTITVLPGTLDLKAWAYLMIEQKSMLLLGGKPDWDFTGFSVGFGAGYDFEWGGSAVYLRAGASIVVGLGTKPLFIKGELTAGGELRFGPVGVGITGKIGLTLVDAPGSKTQLEGEFCGEVDLALFKAKGCVEIHVGGASPPDILPDPLVSGLSLTDRYARVVATGRDVATGGSTGAEHTAWVDARPTLHFSKRVIDGLSSTSIQPTPSSGWGADWSGSARTKFLYRLLSIDLLDAVTGTVISDATDWPSTWWMPAGRPALPVDGDAPSSEHETWDLGLFTWDLAPWARSLIDGGAGTEGSPVTMIERLCDPAPTASVHCVFGADGVRLTSDTVEFSGRPSGDLPWPSYGALTIEETVGVPLDAAQVWAAMLGYRLVSGAVMPLPETFVDPANGAESASAWALPRYDHDRLAPLTCGAIGTYSADADDPDLVLAVSLPLPADSGEVEVCTEFDIVTDGIDPQDPDAPELPDVFDYVAYSITGHDGLVPSDDGWYLTFTERLDVSFGGSFSPFTYTTARRVEATVLYFNTEPVGMRAYDAADNLVAEATIPDDVTDQEPYTLVVEHPAIARVEIDGVPLGAGDWYMHLFSLCTIVSYDIDLDVVLEALARSMEHDLAVLYPAVTGTRLAGDVVWEAEVVEVLSSTERVSAIVRHRPTDRAATAWTGVRVDVSPIFEVAVVSSCFVTTSAAAAGESNDDAREEIVDEWNDRYQSETAEWIHLLDADTRYQVRVDYQVAKWTQADGSTGAASPPAASTVDWVNGSARVELLPGSEVFEFRTAATAPMDDGDVLRYDVQDVFDQRAVARYLAGFDPPNPTIRHLLDDKLLVHFEVEWIETLLDRHGDELRLDVVRTDPPPGDHDSWRDLVVASQITWGSNTSTLNRTVADSSMAVAAFLSGCLDGPVPQGVTACIDADLEPLAEYDLIVRSVPSATPDADGVVITRAHFITSRYRNVDELYATLSFDRYGPMDPFFPFEIIVDAAAPTDEVLRDDVALDDALASMGIDHLPLPDEAAVHLLWRDDGSEWTVVAVLLDALEALDRPPRLEDILDDSPPPTSTVTRTAVQLGTTLVALVDASDTSGDPDGGIVTDYVEAPERCAVIGGTIGATELRPRRINAAATRFLLVPDQPVAVDGNDPVVTLEWSDRGRALSATRYVPSVPRLVSQEWTS